jgi:hypothetical protein
LLYATHYPERLFELRNINMVGPTSFDSPPMAERRVWLGAENAFRTLDPELDGKEGVEGFVAESLLTHDLNGDEAALIERIRATGKVDVVDLGLDAAGFKRLGKLIDLGFVESRDPVTADLSFPANQELV